MSGGPGLRFDLRYDYLNQNEVRNGTGKVGTWPVDGHEQEVFTENKYLTAIVDYSWNPNWGVNFQIPYIDRAHLTNLDGTGTGSSHSQSLGDVKVVGRYMGLTEARNIGIQFGLKLPTGSYTENFSGGDVAGTALDRGLQPGTGTTDVIVGAFNFGSLTQNWDYFAQVSAQLPTNSRDDYKPGNSVNFNVGFKYLGLEKVVPELQVNARVSDKDSGVNASPDDSGGTTIYLSPGVTFPVNEKLKVYGFVQVPVYQNLNGFQLAPKYTLSVGTRFEF